MTTNSQTTLGRTKLVYSETGQLIEQTLPESTYNRPHPELPTRPRKPAPTPLTDILAQVESIDKKLATATAEYEKSLLPGGADPYAREKHTLAGKIAALRAELDPLEARLLEINNTPSPAVQFKNSIAHYEQAINGAGMELTNTLAHEKALELYDQPLESLDRPTQKLVLNRRDVSIAKDIAAPGFARFNRMPEEVRTTEQAKSTAGRIVDAIKLIADVIKSKLS